MALNGCKIDVKCIWYRGSDMKFRIVDLTQCQLYKQVLLSKLNSTMLG